MLEFFYITAERFFERIVRHIEQAVGNLPHCAVGYVEIAAAHNLVDKFFGQRFSRLVVLCKCTQEFFLYGKVFHNL